MAGLLVMTTGVVLIGLAMRPDPAFGKGIATVNVTLGLAGLAAGIVMLIDPHSPAAALGIFALIAFHFITGRKIYKLSKTA